MGRKMIHFIIIILNSFIAQAHTKEIEAKLPAEVQNSDELVHKQVDKLIDRVLKSFRDKLVDDKLVAERANTLNHPLKIRSLKRTGLDKTALGKPLGKHFFERPYDDYWMSGKHLQMIATIGAAWFTATTVQKIEGAITGRFYPGITPDWRNQWQYQHLFDDPPEHLKWALPPNWTAKEEQVKKDLGWTADAERNRENLRAFLREEKKNNSGAAFHPGLDFDRPVTWDHIVAERARSIKEDGLDPFDPKDNPYLPDPPDFIRGPDGRGFPGLRKKLGLPPPTRPPPPVQVWDGTDPRSWNGPLKTQSGSSTADDAGVDGITGKKYPDNTNEYWGPDNEHKNWASTGRSRGARAEDDMRTDPKAIGSAGGVPYPTGGLLGSAFGRGRMSDLSNPEEGYNNRPTLDFERKFDPNNLGKGVKREPGAPALLSLEEGAEIARRQVAEAALARVQAELEAAEAAAKTTPAERELAKAAAGAASVR